MEERNMNKADIKPKRILLVEDNHLNQLIMSRLLKQNTRTNSRVSKFTGVSWHSETQKWRATVSSKGIKYECGYYDTERAAAKGRDMKIVNLNLKKPLQILKNL